MNWWVHTAYQSGGAGAVAAWIFWVITSIVLHELGHGVAAIRNGDNTPRELGHMTLNPMVHMGPVSLLMFAIVGIAWGAMPVNPSRFRRYRWGCFSVAAAGPAVNVVLSAFCILAAGVWLWACMGNHVQVSDQLRVNIFEFFFTGAWLNIVLAAFNLIPVPPLDGSRILAAAVPATQSFLAQPGIAMYGLFVALFVFSSVIMRPLEQLATTWTIQGSTEVAHVLPRVEDENMRGDTLDLVWIMGDPRLKELMREYSKVKQLKDGGGSGTDPLMDEPDEAPSAGGDPQDTPGSGVGTDTRTDPGRDQGTDPRNDPRGFFNQRTKPPANTPPASTPPGFQ